MRKKRKLILLKFDGKTEKDFETLVQASIARWHRIRQCGHYSAKMYTIWDVIKGKDVTFDDCTVGLHSDNLQLIQD